MRIIPLPLYSFSPPVRPEEMTVRSHNRIVKEALRETLAHHWQKHTRTHFQIGASTRYGYAPRSRTYQRRKQRLKGHTIAMLFSGATRAAMSNTQPQMRVGGAAEGGKKGLTGSYFLRFPFSAAVQQHFARKFKGKNQSQRAAMQAASRRPKVIMQLRREMERWAGQEIAIAARGFESRYNAKLAKITGRKRTKRTT